MPSIESSRRPRPTSEPRPPKPATGAAPSDFPATGRHPYMIASLPGIGSGPDAVLRQFTNPQNVPMNRILVP